jgi:hemerythrin-like domain-containing protein
MVERADEDVVDILTGDHREVMALIAEIRRAVPGDDRRELADVLIAELVRHSVAEEMHVYPAMRKHLPDGDEAVEHDIAEHKELEVTMKGLEGADADSEDFMHLVDELESTLRDHIDDEESAHFPQLRSAVPHDELVKLAAKVREAKEAAPTRPHPAAPNAELFHKLVGPGVGMIDRLRDRLSGRATG